jgi:fatty-acid desaturase
MSTHTLPVKFAWATITFLALVAFHVGALAAIPFFTWEGLIVTVILYITTGCLGICVGFHRYFTHDSFKTYRPIRWILAFLGCLAGQKSLLNWVANHRKHHQFSDKEGDPHSPHDGPWWAHMFWFLPRVSQEEERRLYGKYVPDLMKESAILFISNMYGFLIVGLALALFGFGLWLEDIWLAISLVLWGVCLRTVIVWHITWLVNSGTHMWGYKNYPTQDDSRNLWWVALLSFGEGWHNNHHANPTAANHGLHRWSEWWDPSYWVICLLEWCRLAWDVKRSGRLAPAT